MNVNLFSHEEDVLEGVSEDEVEDEIKQTEEGDQDAEYFQGVERRELTPEENRINMDIRTSSLSELAFWCRALGLPEAGTSEDLARRLREYFKIAEDFTQILEDNRKVITIESARSTEYFTIEAVDEDYARLTGEVKISLKDGEAVHEISAWNILFNRTRNIITASGGVVYRKIEGDTVEIFKGETITVDIDNWSSVFLGGISERSIQNEDTTYRFAGTVISKDDEDVTILSRATIKNAKDEESLWSISASRVWLLPGSDFAIFNAVLKVGEIPVLYIPFFYYPADEIVFHPVIGSRTREGSYIQTTTYILGRPSSASSNTSLSRILGNSNDMEKKREGLFLRSTGKKQVDPGATSLVMMLDYYANLGAYIGADLKLPGKKIFGPLDVSLGFGLTQTVAQDASGNHTPFFPNYDGKIDWNWSSFLFFKRVPFRYRFKAASSISGKYGSFSWNIPYYSDPYVETDFMDRAEDMDWINMIQQGSTALEAEITSANQITNYTWQFNGNVTPKLPNMSPYLNLTIGGLSSTIQFQSIDILSIDPSRYNRSTDIEYFRPSNKFFVPDSWTLISFNSIISGTPLNLGGSRTASAKKGSDKNANEYEDILENIGIPRSPFEKAEEEEDTKKEDQEDLLVPPVLAQSFNITQTGNLILSFDYSFNPTLASILKFNSKNWKEYSDVDWGDVNNITSTFSIPTALTNIKFKHSQNLFSNTLTYKGSGTYQHYLSLNEKDSTVIKRDEMQAAGRTGFNTYYGFESEIRPLYRNSIFGSSLVKYKLEGDAIKSKFKENTTTKEPEWEIEYGEWKKEKINTHTLNANISSLILNKSQSVNFSFTLPPREPNISWNAAFNIWITNTSFGQIMKKNEKDINWKHELFRVTELLNFGSVGSFTQNLNFDTEKAKPLVSLSSVLNIWGFNTSFQMERMTGYEWVNDPANNSGDWIARPISEEKLRPSYLNFSYSKSFGFNDLLKNRLNLYINLNTALNFALQKYSDSNFSFDLTFRIVVSNVIELSLSTRSQNDVIYQYVKNIYPFKTANIDLGTAETNVFRDLFNSFRFDNKELRMKSGFKIKSFNISLTHNLGDWTATLNWTMIPYRSNPNVAFEMNNEVQFLLAWKPIDFIKSDIRFNKSSDPQWVVD